MSSVADVIGSHPVTLEAQYVKKTVGMLVCLLR